MYQKAWCMRVVDVLLSKPTTVVGVVAGRGGA